jgi:hypothetical protein
MFSLIMHKENCTQKEFFKTDIHAAKTHCALEGTFGISIRKKNILF